MIVREHVDKSDRLHPSTKKRLNTMTQEPVPLKFKIHSMESIREKQQEAREIQGLLFNNPSITTTPTNNDQTTDDQASDDTTADSELTPLQEASYEKIKAYDNFHLNTPLGPVNTGESLPFSIQRSYRKNLPVYTEFK